ncbi:MAG: 50S ribosomal protein L21, partial [Gammaproteobacteria bacterium]|nr:50S ribosomal protein L21 [Gammaproteobacteria bacterium]
MYAVIETGSKQYRVMVGDRLKVESLVAEPGATVDLSKVLLVAGGDDVQVGQPTLDTVVQATVVGHGRGEKIYVFKMRRRKNSRTRTGHRQNFTELEITHIGGAMKQTPQVTAAEEPAAAAESAADDLTEINGIGPVIVAKLEGLGITTFAQIAALTEADIARLDEELNFKGRIERDDWVGQAKQLAGG